MKIGVVGAGTIGGSVARLLLKAGHLVNVYDVNPSVLQDMATAGASIAETPAQLGRGQDAVFVSLPCAAASAESIEDPRCGLIAGVGPTTCIIDLSTNSPGYIERMRQRYVAGDFLLLDAPVSQATGPASTGAMTIMVGGDPPVLASYRGLLESISSNVVSVGAVGMGTAAKLLTQYVAYTELVTVGEALAVGDAVGLEAASLFAALRLSPASGRVIETVSAYLRDGTNGVHRDSHAGTLNLIHKDLDLAATVLRDAGLHSATGYTAVGAYRRAQQVEPARAEYISVIDMLRNEMRTNASGPADGMHAPAKLFTEGS